MNYERSRDAQKQLARTSLSRFCNILEQADTSSCQDYEEYEFVECLSEETQIIDLLHTKLQPHKLSQYTLATRLSSWYFLGIAGSSGFYSIT